MLLDDYGLLLLLLAASVYDWKYRRIPNKLLLAVLCWGLIYHVFSAGNAGLLYSLKGLLVGMLLLILPFMLGGMGAGDVKFLGTIGAIKGGEFVFFTFWWMALWGGIIALLYLLYARRLKESVINIGRGLYLSCLGVIKLTDSVDKTEFHIYLPYGIPIALGAITELCKVWWF